MGPGVPRLVCAGNDVTGTAIEAGDPLQRTRGIFLAGEDQHVDQSEAEYPDRRVD